MLKHYSYVGCSLVLTMLGGAASASDRSAKLEQAASFHIPAGSLETALIEFSRETRIQVVISAPVANISVVAVEGRRNAREVLHTLLNGTGLRFALVSDTITVYAPLTVGVERK